MTTPAAILLHPHDTVVVAVRPVEAGERVTLQTGDIVATARIATGHKIAYSAGLPGDKVIKYGAPIGSLTHSVQPGDWVHLHNMKSDYMSPHTRAGVARDS